MNGKRWIQLGGTLGALGVAAGAFGAHGLAGLESDGRITAEQLATYEVAVRYQMYHAVALVLVGLLAGRSRSIALDTAGWSFLSGIVVFSGMLYLWVFTGVRGFAMVVPIGGVAFIVGWVALALSARGLRSENAATTE